MNPSWYQRAFRGTCFNSRWAVVMMMTFLLTERFCFVTQKHSSPQGSPARPQAPTRWFLPWGFCGWHRPPDQLGGGGGRGRRCCTVATTGSLVQEAWMSVALSLIPPRFGLCLERPLIHGQSQGEKRPWMSLSQMRLGTSILMTSSGPHSSWVVEPFWAVDYPIPPTSCFLSIVGPAA